MKSIKPGRGPSLLGALGGVVVTAGCVVWTIEAAGAGLTGLLFGAGLTVLALSIAVWHFRSAVGKNRYSLYDVTGADEEPDPLNRRFGGASDGGQGRGQAVRYCPYCGAGLDASFSFCGRCGNRFPDLR